MKKVIRTNEAKVALRVMPRTKKEREVGNSRESQVVAFFPEELSRLEVMPPTTGSDDWWQKVEEVREEVRAELAGRSLPPPEEIIREMREERDEQILARLR